MDSSSNAIELRAALSGYRTKYARGRYPDGLRDRARAYVQAKSTTGVSAGKLARELGVEESTVKQWAKGSEEVRVGRRVPEGSQTAGGKDSLAQGVSLIPLVVRQDAPAVMPRHPRLEIELPDGTRVQVSGIEAREIVEAIGALRRAK